MNLQVIAVPDGTLLWVSGPLRGSQATINRSQNKPATSGRTVAIAIRSALSGLAGPDGGGGYGSTPGYVPE